MTASFQPVDLFAVVLALAMLIGCINSMWIKLPPAIGMLVGSLFLSLLVILSDRVFHLHVMHPLRGTLDAANLPHIFLDGILALLLFASSLHVNIAELRQRRWTILLLATASVILSTLVFGTAMWIVFRLVGATVSLAWCFVLGAILSPTDVVVVETPLRQVNLPPALRVAIVGESLFNDGAGVVLFLVALRVTQGETVSIGHGQVLATLVREIAGAAAIGFVAGRLAAWLIRLIKDEGLQLIVSLALVMGCYRLAILWDLSGPIAVVTAGLCMGSLAPRFGLSTETRPTLIGFWGSWTSF